MKIFKDFFYFYFLKFYLDIKFFLNNFLGIQKIPIKNFTDYKIKNSNVFYGYHDKINIKNNILLSHENKGKDFFVGYFDKNKIFNRIKKTSLCSWQLGSQLQWVDKDIIAFNCENNNKPNSTFYDIKKNKIINSFNQLIYNIDKNKKKFISLNFNDLYKYRNGYGYNLEKFINYKKKENLTIFDYKNKKLFYVIKKNFLIKKFDNLISNKSHFNHATFSPTGKSIIFFLVDTINQKRKILVFHFNLNTKKIILIKEIDKISHYCWINDKKILFTHLKDKNSAEYQIYNIQSKKIKKIGLNLNLDGHPMIHPKNKNLFVSDTYPNKYGFQKLIVFDLKMKKIVWQTSLKFSTYFLSGSRCDLHPKWDDTGKKIIIDYAIKDQRFIRVYDYQV